jgi:hypothetical protein
MSDDVRRVYVHENKMGFGPFDDSRNVRVVVCSDETFKAFPNLKYHALIPWDEYEKLKKGK